MVELLFVAIVGTWRLLSLPSGFKVYWEITLLLRRRCRRVVPLSHRLFKIHPPKLGLNWLKRMQLFNPPFLQKTLLNALRRSS